MGSSSAGNDEVQEPESPQLPKSKKSVTFSADTPFIEDYGIKLSIMKHVFNRDTNCTQYIIKVNMLASFSYIIVYVSLFDDCLIVNYDCIAFISRCGLGYSQKIQ